MTKVCTVKQVGDYKATVTHNRVTNMHHLRFEQKIKSAKYHSKFEMFLEDNEFDTLAEFFNTINGNLRSDLK